MAPKKNARTSKSSKKTSAKNTDELKTENAHKSSPIKECSIVLDDSLSPRRSGRKRKPKKFDDGDFIQSVGEVNKLSKLDDLIAKSILKDATSVKSEIDAGDKTSSTRNLFASLGEDFTLGGEIESIVDVASNIESSASLENNDAQTKKKNSLQKDGKITQNGDEQIINAITGSLSMVTDKYDSDIDSDDEYLKNKKNEAHDVDNMKVPEKLPRSAENERFKEVYKTIPKLRNASPPRFTTKGLRKYHIDHEAMGVRKLGKTLGNPFSSYGRKRNGVVFGNQELNTVSEKLQYTKAANNIKRILKDKGKDLRFSSYVQPHLLEEVRKNFSTRRKKKKVDNANEDEVEVDIETVDDNNISVTADLKKPVLKRKTGRKPGRTILECEDCGYKTTHSGHMRTHVMCVHKDVKRYECNYEGCTYKCSRKGSMTRHEKCVHRKDKVFKCDFADCDFVSAWYISLERHIVTRHEKLRPWKCQICNKAFGQQYTLDSHINSIHKKLKRIKCAFCNFRSCTKMSVRSHILRRHKDEISLAMNEAEAEDGENLSETEKELELLDDNKSDLPAITE